MGALWEYTYKNIFDAMLDALHVALGKIGCGDLGIVVGECGWPTSGDRDATVSNAQTFNQRLINHCKSNEGTPRYPGKPIQCFVFEMYDEDKKPTDARAVRALLGRQERRRQSQIPDELVKGGRRRDRAADELSSVERSRAADEAIPANVEPQEPSAARVTPICLLRPILPDG